MAPRTQIPPAKTAKMTFRELVDFVAREGKPRDARPHTITDIAAACRMSRPHFYNALCGHYNMSEPMLVRITNGLKKFAPWVNRDLVQRSLTRTRALKEEMSL
jgi:hypothetical protein